MVKARVMLSGLLVAGIIAAPVQANDCPLKNGAMAVIVASAATATGVSCYNVAKTRSFKNFKSPVGFEKVDVAQITPGVVSEEGKIEPVISNSRTERTVTVGNYSVGFSVPLEAQGYAKNIMRAELIAKGFTPRNLIVDGGIAAAFMMTLARIILAKQKIALY